MFRKKDLLIIAAVLLLAGAVFGLSAILRAGDTVSGKVHIFVDGAPAGEADLSDDGEIRIEQPGGEVNVIQVKNGGVFMAYSSCKNQLCVHQGTVTADNWTRRSMGRSIICLPNRVLVELALDEEHPSMQDPDAPDI